MLIQKISLSPESVLSLWKIDEDESTLQNLLKQQLSETNFKTLHDSLQSIGNANRRKEKLCTHLLLGLDALILYEESGKPYTFVDSNTINLSISHTKDYVALVQSQNETIGIDMELISDRAEKIAPKFLSEYEKTLIQNPKNFYYTLFWCIKEALYKWYGKGELDFIENLQVLDTELNTKISLKDKTYNLKANFCIEEENLLVVWC